MPPQPGPSASGHKKARSLSKKGNGLAFEAGCQPLFGLVLLQRSEDFFRRGGERHGVGPFARGRGNRIGNRKEDRLAIDEGRLAVGLGIVETTKEVQEYWSG